ncbi:MAG: manno-octulosonate cytidylyltransferase [Phycisphaerales bacterium]
MSGAPAAPGRTVPHATIIIPARLASTRFPEKVLASKTGKPLIQHVHESASRARCAQRVVIAADHERIRDAAERFGAMCILTRPDHPNGTSRIAEAAATLGLPPDAVIVNAQGDEPDLDPALIDAAVEALERSGAPVATAAVPFGPGEDPANPAIVKVVLACRGPEPCHGFAASSPQAVPAIPLALYFSRALIPHQRDPGAAPPPPLKHVGLYVYRRAFLDDYLRMPPTPLEQTEQLEQLRILESGYAIAVAVGEHPTHGGIDTPEQYEAFVRRLRVV